ncbi:MAG: deoxycytidylate deaminase [Culicoidibacterales bacterium]
MKRTTCLNWDQYFMGIALLSAQRSKDPSTQVGACIVNQKQRIVGIGYNGFPYGCHDDEFPWEREGDVLETKYPYVVHAELNAILNSSENLSGACLYVSLFPCNECAKAIIQSGIQELVYMSDKYDGTVENQASKRMFAAAKVKLRQMEQLTITIEEQQ